MRACVGREEDLIRSRGKAGGAIYRGVTFGIWGEGRGETFGYTWYLDVLL